MTKKVKRFCFVENEGSLNVGGIFVVTFADLLDCNVRVRRLRQIRNSTETCR
jgi:hypothetical protein